MLELKNIKKSYKTGDFVQHALKGVSLKFRTEEFVAILGPSGSGKTTLLNIVGGLDRYDTGDLIINEKSTKDFKDKNWDSYRNNCVGFIFQSYNLISHISVLENVEMSTTLSGYSKKRRKNMAIDALNKVGLADHIHKKPNQLSGGQMQRVAIARALVNNPDIILADEPTGALDTKTSKQIMDLIKEVAKDKLVIMVTHNPELAKEYATRIIEFKDGEIIKDSKPVTDKEKSTEKFKIKKTAMSYRSAINLSFNNLKTKKGRTFITSLASSIGIIGIALILSLSNGFQIKIDEFEKDTLSQAPILISEQSMDLNSLQQMNNNNNNDLEEYTKKKKIYPQKTIENSIHLNKITNEYIEKIENIDSKYIGGLSYTRATNLNLLTKVNDQATIVDSKIIMSMLPTNIDGTDSTVMTDNFEMIYGEKTTNKEDLYLLVDSKNRLSENALKALGFEQNEIDFKNIIGKELKVVLNDQYYKEIAGRYIISNDLNELYNNEENITLTIKGIIRGKKDNTFAEMSGSGVLFNKSLMDYVIEKNSESSIVKAQQNSNNNILTMEPFATEKDKTTMLTYLGAKTAPMTIQIYPKDFESKDKILKVLDNYNKGKSKEDKIIYIDQAKMITSLSGNIMDAITIVLIAFSSISLIVSSIMVGIITYTSVLERTKEIGILRALGARKKDITRVFNAETLIIGFSSGILGIIIARLLIIPTNIIINNLSKLPDVAKLNPIHAVILITISMLLTLIGGLIPARIASKKDPVIALRTE